MRKRTYEAHMMRHSHIRARNRSHYVCGWMQMIIIDRQLCPWKISALRAEKEK